MSDSAKNYNPQTYKLRFTFIVDDEAVAEFYHSFGNDGYFQDGTGIHRLETLTLSAALGAGDEETSILKKFSYAYRNKLDADTSIEENEHDVVVEAIILNGAIDEFYTVLGQPLGHSDHITFTLHKKNNPQDENADLKEYNASGKLIYKMVVFKICIEPAHEPGVTLTRNTIRNGYYLMWTQDQFRGRPVTITAIDTNQQVVSAHTHIVPDTGSHIIQNSNLDNVASFVGTAYNNNNKTCSHNSSNSTSWLWWSLGMFLFLIVPGVSIIFIISRSRMASIRRRPKKKK